MKQLDFFIAVGQTSPVPGNVRSNLQDILAKAEEAKKNGAKLFVVPEVALSGYLLGDRWENDSFIREIEQANAAIRQASQGMVIIWGTVVADWDKIGEDGRTRKYNAVRIAANGKYLSNGTLNFIPKANLPKYRVFDDARHFYPAAKLALEMGVPLETLLKPFVVILNGKQYRIGLLSCEDMWHNEYQVKPVQFYAEHGTDLLIDVSSSPWTAEKWRARDRTLQARVRESGIPILYVNNVGLQNNVKNLIWFDGDSCFLNGQAERVWNAPRNETGVYCFNPSNACGRVQARLSGIEEIHEALLPAVRAFYGSFPRVAVALSGGIDSTVMLAILCEALGPNKLLAVNMPTVHNGLTTRRIAAEAARMLGVTYKVSSIQEVFDQDYTDLVRLGLQPSQLTLENAQARLRCNRVAAIAQQYGGVFTNNSNKTENGLNYCTLYGDATGAAAFLADLWKGQVFALARRLPVPEEVLVIPPSAELSSDQNVDDGKGDPIFYPYHDYLLRAFTEKRWDITNVMEALVDGGYDKLEQDLGCDRGVIDAFFSDKLSLVTNLEWVWRQYHIEFKRGKFPPIFLASRRAFGFDRRDTIAGAYFTDKYGTLRDAYLST